MRIVGNINGHFCKCTYALLILHVHNDKCFPQLAKKMLKTPPFCHTSVTTYDMFFYLVLMAMPCTKNTVHCGEHLQSALPRIVLPCVQQEQGEFYNAGSLLFYVLVPC